MEHPDKDHVQTAADMARIMRLFHERGWSMATSTNCSFRRAGSDTFFVSRSGVDKSAFSEGDFLQAHLSEIPDPDGPQPSAETPIHVLIYRLFPDTQSILHTHSLPATVVSLHHEAAGYIRFQGFEMQKAIAGIQRHDTVLELPVFSNSQDMPRLCRHMAPYLNTHRSCRGLLLAGHGLYAWGNSDAEAKRHTEAYEFLINCILYQLPKR
jgi:methylthioribulose-1-phosphate dehydratase